MTRDYRQEFAGTATASAGRRGRNRDIRRPGRATALGPLTAVPNSGEHAPGRAYDLAELDESRGPELCCALCAGVIEPGTPMTYYADARGGFVFYHLGCAVVPEALA